VPASHVLSVINGNIVALCGVDLTEESSSGSESENTSGLRVLTQRSSLCTCYGFGKNIFLQLFLTDMPNMFPSVNLPDKIFQQVSHVHFM